VARTLSCVRSSSPRAGKQLLVRQRIRPAYIIVEEIRERATGKFFSLKTNVEGIAIELPFPGKVRIHGAQEIVKAPLIFRAIAQDDVEQKAKHLALRVIRNAALGLVVERVFFPATRPGWTARHSATLRRAWTRVP